MQNTTTTHTSHLHYTKHRRSAATHPSGSVNLKSSKWNAQAATLFSSFFCSFFTIPSLPSSLLPDIKLAGTTHLAHKPRTNTTLALALSRPPSLEILLPLSLSLLLLPTITLVLATATARTYHQTLGSGAWSGQFIILPCPSVLPFGDNRPQITCATTATHTGHKGWGRERGERKLDLRGGGGPETSDCEMRARKAATEQRNKRQQAAEQQLNAKKTTKPVPEGRRSKSGEEY